MSGYYSSGLRQSKQTLAYDKRYAQNNWLNFCRSLAILFVLISHGRHFLTSVNPTYNVLKLCGFIGVEIFFVLSGFLIGKILIESVQLHTPNKWLLHFWVRRWLRTIPNYVLFLVVNLFLLNSIRPAEPFHIINFLTFTQNLYSRPPDFFGESWSLSVEEVYYLISPVLLLGYYFLLENKNRAVLVTALSIFIFSLLLRSVRVLSAPADFGLDIRAVIVYRLDAIACGLLLSWIIIGFRSYLRKCKKLISNILMLLVLLMPISMFFAALPDEYLNQNNVLKILLFTMTSFGSMGLIYIGLNYRFSVISGKIFECIARWSYAAYLTNLPCYFFLMQILPKTNIFYVALAHFMVFIALSFITAAFVYHGYEQHFLKLRNKLFP